MRDVERLREKHQISLDDRQVAALAVCVLLLVGGVFAIGVALGKRLAHAAPAPAGLAQLDETARRPPPATPAAPGPGATGRTGNAPAAGPPPPSHEEAARAMPANPPHALVPSAPQTPVVVPPPARAVQVASLVPAPLPPPPRDLGPFTVQLGASQDRADAQRLEARVRAAGLKPYVVEADLGRKGVWYRVRVGSFADKEAASRFRKDVERELDSPAVVMATR